MCSTRFTLELCPRLAFSSSLSSFQFCVFFYFLFYNLGCLSSSLIYFQVVESPCDSALVPDGAALSAFQYFENVRNFLVGVQEMGIPTFEASDLEQVCIQGSGFSKN